MRLRTIRRRTGAPLARARARLPAIVALLLLLLLPASCSAPGADLGGDPCLLQQYQGHAFSIVSQLQSALSTLSGRADALSPQSASISASQDVTETLTALAEFHLTLGKLWNLLVMGAHPAEGQAIAADVKEAIRTLDTGAAMLTQAYVDVQSQDPLAANVVAIAARNWMRQGRVLLGQASDRIAALNDYSPNC